MKKSLLLMMYIVCAAHIAIAQTWSLTGTHNDNWQCIASSADGKKLIAGTSSGFLYVSRDSGRTWKQTSAPNKGWWNSVASSADGKTLAAIAADFNPGVIFCSTNSGATWTSNLFLNIAGVAMSADGTKIVAVAPPNVWRSTNSGTTWMQVTSTPSRYGSLSPSQYIASSADGKKLVYAGSYEQIYISTNSGDSWNLTSAPNNPWLAVASSGDGNTLLAVPNEDSSPYPIYVSTNAGTTWTTNNSPNLIWESVACSADGGKLFAAAFGDTISDPNSGSIYRSRSVQPPLMDIAAGNGDLLLSWLVPSTNFVLQESPDLSEWTEVTNAPVLNLCNLQNQVSLSSTNQMNFYRLSTP
jgi:photosystem II stability/assembly factor-like uncharacterized protein